jgi:type IX secretion system PorP/SprF family membrane protein
MKTLKTIATCIVSLFLVVVSVRSAYSQQDPMYSQYMFNIQSYNPAYAGTWESIGIMALGRQQWVGFNQAPDTYTFTIQAPLRSKNVGLGLTVIQDDIGFEKRFGLFGDYSYRLKMKEGVYLRLGVKAGITNYSNNLMKYTTYPDLDPSFNDIIDQKYMPNFGIGAFLSSDRYYLGLSVPKILKNDFELGATDYKTEYAIRHFFLIGGYVFDMSKVVKFKPSFNLRAVTASPVVADINASFLFADRFGLEQWDGPKDRLGRTCRSSLTETSGWVCL